MNTDVSPRGESTTEPRPEAYLEGDARLAARAPRPLPIHVFAALAVAATWLAFHFVAVLLHVTPANPVNLTARSWVQSYIDPYFLQQWRLFAPKPGGRDENVHVRCHYTEGGQAQSTEWRDITKPMIEAHRGNRLGAAGMVQRANKPRLFNNDSSQWKALEHLSGVDAERARRLLEARREQTLERGKRHMQRIASASCKRSLRGRDVVIDEVEARFVTSHVPSYASRNTGKREPATAFELDPMPYVEVTL